MTKEQEVFEKVNRIRIDFFDSKYKDVHTDDELEEKYEALGDVLNMLKDLQKENKYMHSELDRQQTTINNYAKEIEKKKNFIEEIDKEIEANIYLAESNYNIKELNDYARGVYDTYINMRMQYFERKARDERD